MDHSEFVLTKDTIDTALQMAEQLPGGFVVYQENKSRDILYVNRHLLEIYECDDLDQFKELTGYTFDGMVHPDDFSIIQNSIDEQIGGVHGSHDHVEYRILTRKGNVKWLDDYGHFSYSEDYGDLYYVFLIDITEQKRAQAAERTFFFDMSHEVITPMNAVSNFIKLALKHKDDPALMEQYLKDADGASEKLTAIIHGIVNIERGRDDGLFENSENIAPGHESAGNRKEFAEGNEADDRRECSEVNEGHEAGHDTGDPSGKLRVLVADDNEINQFILRKILEEAGFTVDSVDDGDDAVEMVRSHGAGYYSIVLMDIRMNRMDGYEATRLIRKLPFGGMDELPIVAVSANSREEDRIASRECGMNGHMPKPYDPDRIIDVVLKCAGERQSD